MNLKFIYTHTLYIYIYIYIYIYVHVYMNVYLIINARHCYLSIEDIVRMILYNPGTWGFQ